MGGASSHSHSGAAGFGIGFEELTEAGTPIFRRSPEANALKVGSRFTAISETGSRPFHQTSAKPDGTL
jgi:hypothetical protein